MNYLKNIQIEAPENVVIKTTTNIGNIILSSENEYIQKHYEHCSQSLHIIIPENTIIEDIISLKGLLETESFDHISLQIKAHSKVTIIEDMNSLEKDGYRNQVVEIEVEEGAHLSYINFHTLPEDWDSISHYRAQVYKGAKILWYSANFGSHNHTSCIQSHLMGDGAESQIRAIFYGHNNQKIHIDAGNKYDALHTYGEIYINGVVKDHAHGICNGLIDITKKGQYTDSYMKQTNLILDDTARIDATPQLEIDANEVKAGHGAAISKVNPEDIFYLQSRGISKEVAEKMIVNGFLQAFTEEFTDIPYVTERTKELVENK